MGIIIKPIVTEKMTAITEKSNNRFGFIVRPDANKLEIKKEVEALYNVTVVDVNTMRYAGKSKSRYTRAGLINGRTNAYKKAIVTLKEGDTISVKLVDIDPKTGKFKLSHKVLMPKPEGYARRGQYSGSGVQFCPLQQVWL